MLAVQERMKHDDVTVHGLRSTFRDWAAECTNYPNHVVEMQLAHSIRDKAEAAYRHGDLLEQRRPLFEAWARYCDKATVPRSCRWLEGRSPSIQLTSPGLHWRRAIALRTNLNVGKLPCEPDLR